MKRFCTILILWIFCNQAFSQNYRLAVSESNLYFNKFSYSKVLFNGISGEYDYFIKRFGVNFGVSLYFPQKYYGSVSYENLSAIETLSIPVYAKGSANTINFGMSYNILRLKSEKFKIIFSTGFIDFNHSATYNEEPFYKIYGGYCYDISVSFFSDYVGLTAIYKVGYVPLHISVKKAFSIGKQEYNDFKVPGFLELNVGISFPILKSPPPTEIKKINL